MAKKKVAVVTPVEVDVEQVHEEAVPEVAAFIQPAMSFADRSKLIIVIADATLGPVGCSYQSSEYLDAANFGNLVEVYPQANERGLFPVRATDEGLHYAETLKASSAAFEPLHREEDIVPQVDPFFGLIPALAHDPCFNPVPSLAPEGTNSHAFEVEDVPVAQARTRAASYDLHRLSVGQSIFIAGKKDPGMIVSQANNKLKPARFSWAKAEKNGIAGIRVGRVS